MKKLIVALLLLSSISYSQNVTKKETINQYLCKTWKADYAMMNGLKVEKMGQMKSLVYTFKADHTYLVKQVVGNWAYNEKKKCIELFLNKDLKSVITKLDGKSMVMNLNATKDTPKGAPKFEIFFKPKS